jgi:hypothetical protein
MKSIRLPKGSYVVGDAQQVLTPVEFTEVNALLQNANEAVTKSTSKSIVAFPVYYGIAGGQLFSENFKSEVVHIPSGILVCASYTHHEVPLELPRYVFRFERTFSCAQTERKNDQYFRFGRIQVFVGYPEEWD